MEEVNGEMSFFFFRLMYMKYIFDILLGFLVGVSVGGYWLSMYFVSYRVI